ncbi:MAG: hypothetical protein ACK5N9_07270, partial [Pirellula sp.]
DESFDDWLAHLGSPPRCPTNSLLSLRESNASFAERLTTDHLVRGQVGIPPALLTMPEVAELVATEGSFGVNFLHQK